MSTGLIATPVVLPEGWLTAYDRLHREGLAAFPPAALHYVMNVVRQATQNPELKEITGASEVEERATHAASIGPAAVIAAFRTATRADFGPLQAFVLSDWGLKTPADLGLAVSHLGHAGCLTLDDGDAPEFYALYENPFTGELP